MSPKIYIYYFFKFTNVPNIFAINDSIIAVITGRKPLQELTNIKAPSLPKPNKDLEENSVSPVRRRRATVCYKEPKINRLVFVRWFLFVLLYLNIFQSMLDTLFCNWHLSSIYILWKHTVVQKRIPKVTQKHFRRVE